MFPIRSTPGVCDGMSGLSCLDHKLQHNGPGRCQSGPFLLVVPVCLTDRLASLSDHALRAGAIVRRKLPSGRAGYRDRPSFQGPIPNGRNGELENVSHEFPIMVAEECLTKNPAHLKDEQGTGSPAKRQKRGASNRHSIGVLGIIGNSQQHMPNVSLK
jgi:hypothetical protein